MRTVTISIFTGVFAVLFYPNGFKSLKPIGSSAKGGMAPDIRLPNA